MDIERWRIECAKIIQRAWSRFILRAFYLSIRSKSSSYSTLSGSVLTLIHAATCCPNAVDRLIGSQNIQQRQSWKFHHLHYMAVRLFIFDGYCCNICHKEFDFGALMHSCENTKCDWDICDACYKIHGDTIVDTSPYYRREFDSWSSDSSRW